MTDQSDYLWDPRSRVVDPQVVALESALQRFRFEPATFAAGARPVLSLWTRIRVPAVAAAMLLIGATTLLLRPAKWSVRAEGTVTVSNLPVTSSTRLRPGETLVTGDGSSASVKVGSIGEVRLGAGSVIRLESAEATGHRFSLERGEVHARIWAKPRFFEVATTRVRAVDLGCIYTLRVDERGAASLEVYYGAVELAGPQGSTFVPGGNAAVTDSSGQSVPWPLTSTPAFRTAAMVLSSGTPDSLALAALLGGADPRATITLWHLLPRVDVSMRTALVAGLAAIVAPPAGVSLSRVANLDANAMAAWEAALRPGWQAEPVTAWRKFLVKWGLSKPRALLTRPEGRS
jgi:hypothetical protein